jgi:hypothetical protein
VAKQDDPAFVSVRQTERKTRTGSPAQWDLRTYLLNPSWRQIPVENAFEKPISNNVEPRHAVIVIPRAPKVWWTDVMNSRAGIFFALAVLSLAAFLPAPAAAQTERRPSPQVDRGNLVELPPEETGDAPGTLYEARPPDAAGRIIYMPRAVSGSDSATAARTSVRKSARATKQSAAKPKLSAKAARAAARRAARAAARAEAPAKAAVKPEPETTATVDPPLRKVPDPPPIVESSPAPMAPPARRMIEAPPPE